jgi:hypothetical protein
VDLDYLEQFSHERMEACLLRTDNLDPLEHILSGEAKELDTLEKIKPELKLKQAMGPEDVTGTFSRIRSDINAFLQVEDIRVPSLSPFDLFDGTNTDVVRSYVTGLAWLGCAAGAGTAIQVRNRLIRHKGKTPTWLSRRAFLLCAIPTVPAAGYLLKAGVFHRQRRNDGAYLADKEEISYGQGYCRAKTLLFIAHEYTHHVQHVMGFYYGKGVNLTLALEGHARGVDQYLSRQFSERLHARGYLYHYLKTSVKELTETYLWMCHRLNRSPRASILNGPAQSRITTDPPWAHGPGHALFRIYAQAQGEQIYAHMLDGRFVFPD